MWGIFGKPLKRAIRNTPGLHAVLTTCLRFSFWTAPVLLAASFCRQAATMSSYEFTPRAVASPDALQKDLVLTRALCHPQLQRLPALMAMALHPILFSAGSPFTPAPTLRFHLPRRCALAEVLIDVHAVEGTFLPNIANHQNMHIEDGSAHLSRFKK